MELLLRKGQTYVIVLISLCLLLSGCFGGGSRTTTYAVSGKVVDRDRNGIEGVTLAFTGGTTGTANTKHDGSWKATFKGKVTVTPIMSGYSFQPSSRTITNTSDSVNFTALRDISSVLEEIKVVIGPSGGTIASDSYPDALKVIIPRGALKKDSIVTYRVLDGLPSVSTGVASIATNGIPGFPEGVAFTEGKPISLEIDLDAVDTRSHITLQVETSAEYDPTKGIAVYSGDHWVAMEPKIEHDYWYTDVSLEFLSSQPMQIQAKTLKTIICSAFWFSKVSNPGQVMEVYEFKNGNWSIDPVFRTGETKTGFMSGNGDDIILMVHGILFGSYDGWTDLARDITNMNPDKKIYAVEYGLGYSINKLAEWLSVVIKQGVTGGQRINVIAHSQGGVVSRAALELHGASGHVSRLVTLASPHLGAAWNTLATAKLNIGNPTFMVPATLTLWLIAPEILDLATGSPFFWKLNGNIQALDCEYYFAAATDYMRPEFFPLALAVNWAYESLLLPIPIHDGVVEKLSALGWGLGMSQKRSNFDTVEFPLNHSAIATTPCVFAQIVKWLDISEPEPDPDPPLYRVEGRVTDSNGNGIKGVSVKLRGENIIPTSVTTSHAGTWDADIRGSVEITPSKWGYTFDPPSIEVDGPRTCVDFIGTLIPTEYTGRVVIEGQAPGKPITIRLKSFMNSACTIETDSSGYFTVPSTIYELGDEIDIAVRILDNFSEDYARSRGLNTWVRLQEVFIEPGVWRLPDLDLYGYGFKLIRPADKERVTSFPYKGQIQKYGRGVDEIYWLYFTDFEDRMIGASALVFSEDMFLFDGMLEDGSVLYEDAIWYVETAYIVDDYIMRINTWGNQVYLGLNTFAQTESVARSNDCPSEGRVRILRD